MIGQPVIEDIIYRKLDNVVCYGERVVAILETEEGIKTTTDRGRVVLSKYAVAADGARSTVRNVLNISFEGAKPEMVWAVLDTFIDTDFPECSEIITFQLNGQSRVSWIPRERNMARFYVLLDGEITQKRAEDSIREHMAPHRIDFKKTEWFSTFEGKQWLVFFSFLIRIHILTGVTVKERIASTFVSKNGLGRIMLAGDAAHVHSVNGGQGLNTGIADAFGLAWRISMAVNASGHGKIRAADLIRTYDIERQSVAQEVINVAASLVRDTVHTAKQYVSTIERNAGYITGERAQHQVHQIARVYEVNAF
jgi:phenol 2-monooxygenase